MSTPVPLAEAEARSGPMSVEWECVLFLQARKSEKLGKQYNLPPLAYNFKFAGGGY